MHVRDDVEQFLCTKRIIFDTRIGGFSSEWTDRIAIYSGVGENQKKEGLVHIILPGEYRRKRNGS